MTTTTLRRTSLVVGLVGTAAAVLLGSASATASTGASTTGAAARDDRGLTAVRTATAQFRDVDVATAQGYVPVSPCEQLPGAGGMGIHYLHPGLAADGEVIPTRPEILLYEPTEDGLALVGVEYFVTEDAAAGRTPSVLGRSFEGPMDGHGPGMPRHYDLHLWVWEQNPNGVSATWNPAVTCDGDS